MKLDLRSLGYLRHPNYIKACDDAIIKSAWWEEKQQFESWQQLV